MSDTQHGKVNFIPKEGVNELYIALEPMGGTMPILERGFFSLTMRGRPDWKKVQEVATFLRENCDGLMFQPGSAHIVHADFGGENK